MYIYIYIHFSRCSGDEGQAQGGTYMAFHVQSDLSPCLTNAAASRFLITTIPSCYYVSWQLLICSIFSVGGGVVPLILYKLKTGHPKIQFQVFDGGVNITLQAAAKIICWSLNQLADHGVPIPDVQAPWFSNDTFDLFPFPFKKYL